MKYLITGTGGFIGFHLAQNLLKEDKVVIGIDNFNPYYPEVLKRSRHNLLKQYPNFIEQDMDICNLEALKKCFQEYKPDIVCHLAAQAGVRYSLENPFVYQKSNLEAFVNILELTYRHNLKKFVYASSSSVYGNVKTVPFKETEEVNTPISLYAATKKSNELIAHTYTHLYDIETIGLRFFTVYGPWGRPDMAIWKFTQAIIAGEPLTVFNYGNCYRDFTYIDDIVDGIKSALNKSGFSKYEIINLGNNNPEKVTKVISILEEKLGAKAELNFLPLQPGDMIETFADISYAQQKLDYSPKTSIEEGIAEFITWFKKYEGLVNQVKKLDVWDKNMLYKKFLKIILLLLFVNVVQNCYCQILWEDQLIFKTHLYDKTGEMNGYVLIYAPEHKKLIALDAQTGEPIKTEYNLKGKELFLNTPKDKFIKKQILFFAKQKDNTWQLEIYHFTGQKITLTGKPFKLPKSTREILSLKYKNGYIYYLYETKDNSLVLERKHIQCTAVGLPTFSNETSELYYDSSIDGFLILPHFVILPDGLDATKDIVMLVARGKRVKAKVFARMADCETLPPHTIVKLPDQHVSLTPPRGTSFPTVILHGTRQKGYDICLIGHRRNQTHVYIRRMGKNDIEIDELEMIPTMGGNLYCQPFWIRGNWWFPIKESQGIKLIFYSEMQGGRRFSTNYFDCPNLYLISDPRNATLLYGLSKDSWRKYALSYSLNDWKKYGGFRSLQFGKKSLYTLPSNIAMGKKIKEYEPAQVTGSPYIDNKFSLKPVEKIDIESPQGYKINFTYLTTKEKMNDFILTRKYCLLYNNNFYPKSPVNSPENYEYHLCWQASYGSDNSIKGFYLTYQDEKILLIKVANQIYKVSCTKNKESRIQHFSLSNIKVIDGIHDKDWYQKDLSDIQEIKFLDRINNKERYLLITQKNIYQAIIEQNTIKLVEARQVTGPVKEIYFSHLSQDNSILYCGGVSQLNRTFLAELLLLPESKQNKYPTFSGSIYNYVQDTREQYIRRPQKIINRGNIVYILNYKGYIEAYEKTLGSFNFNGGIKLESKILDISLIDNTLCLLTKKQLYCLDLSMKEIGTSLQSHFNKNNIKKNFTDKIIPVKLTKNKDFLFIHFPKILQCLKIKNSSVEKESILVNSNNMVQAGFHIIKGDKGNFYIGANKKLFKYTNLEIFKGKMLKPWLTIDTNICQLFYDKGMIYYLSRDGQIGAIKE